MLYKETCDINLLGEGRYITPDTVITANSSVIIDNVKSLVNKTCDERYYSQISFLKDMPQNVKSQVFFEGNEEAYVIEVLNEKINVYSLSDRGLLYGSLTLQNMAKDGYVESMLLYDCPVCSVRGAKIYLPGEDGIGFFKEYIDMLCYFGYNTVMIELGGAMEYKRHPDINEKWVEYSREMSEYSGKSKDIQNKTYKWYKNSIHTENGYGGYISQDQVRELIEHCRDRYMEVIPEVPTLSHSDYLLLAHPELSERTNDPYPDTYCPSHPDTYKLIFDVLDEVVEVFDPKYINIGHDEWYSIGICDRCRGKKPEELYAGDIIRIHDYLSQKGVKTIMWGDKLLDGRKGLQPQGGAEIPMFQNYDRQNGEYLGVIPATYKSIDLIPDDTYICNWYWHHDNNNYDLECKKRGLGFMYGNFRGSEINNWKQRLDNGVKGVVISNWSYLKEQTLRRNGVLFELAYCTRMLWDKDFTGEESEREETRDMALSKLFEYKTRDIGKPDLSNSGQVRYLKLVHTVDAKYEYNLFEDGNFIDNNKFHLASYILKYKDGTKKKLPVIYGENISSCSIDWSVDNLAALKEISFSTLPVKQGGRTYYVHYYKNPYTGSDICSIKIEVESKQEVSLYINEISLIGVG